MSDYDEKGFLKREKIKLPFDVILLAYMWEVFPDLRYVVHLFPNRNFHLGLFLCRMPMFLSEELMVNIKEELKKRFNYEFTEDQEKEYAYHIFEDMMHDLYKDEIAERLKNGENA